MNANQFGERFCVTTFGESHGTALGAVIDGCPAEVVWDQGLVDSWMARRRPGGALVSSRSEQDAVEVLSGIFDGKTLGTPIALLTRNRDARSKDYTAPVARLGHADDVWKEKFGIADPRGGGRASGRETVARVMAAAVAQMFARAKAPELTVSGFVKQIGPIGLSAEEIRAAEIKAAEEGVAGIEKCAVRFPSAEKSDSIQKLLRDAKEQGQSYGGVVRLMAYGVPRGLGQPVAHKLKSDLALALVSVGAVSGVNFGTVAELQSGTELHVPGQTYGGIRGGISTGEPLSIDVAIKPTSSIGSVALQGRHDPSIVPRALVVLEAMVWLVLADHLLWARGDRA